MARWEQGTVVEGTARPRWQQGAPADTQRGQRLAQAGMAGASRGVLGTLDIVPRGIAAAINPALQAAGLQPWQGRPFQALGAAAPGGGVGTYQPQTPGEETAAFAGELTGASLLPGAAAVRMATAPVRALGTEAAATGGALVGGLAGEQIAGPEGRTIGAIAGGLSPMAAPYAARRFVGPYGAETLPERVAAAQRQQVPITAGQATGGSFLEKASATLPGGQRAAETFAQRQADRMGERVMELTSRQSVAEPSSEAAGRAIQRGVNEWVGRFKARGGELYDEVDVLIPPETTTPLTNTRRALEELTTEDADLAKILDAPLVRQLSRVIGETESVPYELASKIRTRVGSRLASPGVLADAPTGEIKQLYGALSKDLEDVAMAAGPEAERAATKASQYWKAGHKRVDDFLEPLQKKKLPEQAYKASMAGTNEGASRLRAIKKSVSPEQWNVVVATTLRRLGRTVPSGRTAGDIGEEVTDFSPETFLTNLERLDPKAQSTLFSGTRYAGLERNLNDLKSIAQGIREQRLAAYNPSGTAGALGNISWLSALPFINPAQTMRLSAGVGGNVLMQKALQSPQMLEYLAQPKAFMPSAAGQLTRAATAVSDPELEDLRRRLGPEYDIIED